MLQVKLATDTNNTRMDNTYFQAKVICIKIYSYTRTCDVIQNKSVITD